MSGAKTDEASSLTPPIEARFETEFTDVSVRNEMLDRTRQHIYL
jgi:hypothetical protein